MDRFIKRVIEPIIVVLLVAFVIIFVAIYRYGQRESLKTRQMAHTHKSTLKNGK
jgi:hypothetical protein